MSRLDKLVGLLETGSSEAVKRAAATQIGEIQRDHPGELQTLLTRVADRLLYGAQWETRTSACHAFEAILDNVPPWSPKPREAEAEAEAATGKGATPTERRRVWRQRIDKMDIAAMLDDKVKLVGSAGSEYGDVSADATEQRKCLKEQVGDFVDIDEFVNESDLHGGSVGKRQLVPSATAATVKKQKREQSDAPPQPAPQQQPPQSQQQASGSVRQMANAKRKAKFARTNTPSQGMLLSREQSKSQSLMPSACASKLVATDQPMSADAQSQGKVVLETLKTETLSTNGSWPFESIVCALCSELTNPFWEVRHGAAMGMRALLKTHAAGAGMEEGMSAEELSCANSECLEDLAARLIELLCRDRFADFGSDTAVAPVRETCAQALGLLAKSCTDSAVAHRILSTLLSICGHKSWEVRLSGTLAIKYVVALRTDIATQVLPQVLESIRSGILDLDDDVRGASASVLLPVSQILVKDDSPIRPSAIDSLGRVLWQSISDIDDLTASTAPIMELLADLYTHADPARYRLYSPESLAEYVPMLLPYLHHNIDPVRAAALRTLTKLLGNAEANRWLPAVMRDIAIHLYHSVVTDKSMNDLARSAWDALTQNKSLVCTVCFPLFPTWINMLRTPAILLQRDAPLFGKKTSAELFQECVNDVEISKLLSSGICSEALCSGCRAIGHAASCFGSEFSNVFAMLECLVDYPSQVTSIINGLILFHAAPLPSGLSPRLAAQCQIHAANGAPNPREEVDLRTRVSGVAAAAIVHWGLPQKLNDVIHGLLALVKVRDDAHFQDIGAQALAALIAGCALRKNSPNAKLVANLFANSGVPGECSGVAKTVKHLTEILGGDVLERVPRLWEIVRETLTRADAISTAMPANPLCAISMFTILVSSVPPALRPKVLELFPNVVELAVCSPEAAVQERATMATAVACKEGGAPAMAIVIEHLLPFLRPAAATAEKQAAAKAVHEVITSLDLLVVPYSSFFIGPLLSCISDQNQSVREGVAFSFGALVRLLPLEAASQDSSKLLQEGLPAELVARRDTERVFLQQLLDGKRLETAKLPFSLNGELRRYQQEGVNWLAFLRKYHLHGVLCDDMGLGKTLQALCAMAAAALDANDELSRTRPSLVACPPTLVGHWTREIARFVEDSCLHPVAYVGTPSEREFIRTRLGPRQVLVLSYEVLRKDAELFGDVTFNYCILDEGHVIKNPKTKLSQAVKKVRASSRLILTGTPLQNNVLELWSLFDFLIPGFLGTEQSFNERFSKPILQSRDTNCSAKEQESGLLAMEALRKQVQPFLLRRVKEDVLQDLPPKIIQDFVVELSPLQTRLYEDFASNRGGILSHMPPASGDGDAAEKQQATGMLQALQLLRKVCAHPALALDTSHPEYASIMEGLEKEHSSLRDIRQSAKLVALRDLLLQCGIGSDKDEDGESAASGGTQHRVLVFAQFKTLLDIVEQDLFRKHMPDVTYLRLDGSVPAAKRQDVVAKFNSDPTIDVLLLTTQVGGLGLTLTGADVVIFLEHDWNPTRDLQAMDRAHRIGQTKVVSVYRVITRGTIEEKIMGLQKFKTHLANTVVSKESESSLLATMDTANMLDLFSLSSQQQQQQQQTAPAAQADSSKGLGKKLSAVLQEIGELWDEADYEKEFNTEAFLKTNK